MPLLHSSRDLIAQALSGQPFIAYDSSNAYIAVGDSDAPFDSSHTSLQGANQARKSMDAGYPSVIDNTLVFQATFNEDEALFPWNEWGIVNDSEGGTFLNRKVEYNGTKLNGQVWILRCEVPLVTELEAQASSKISTT